MSSSALQLKRGLSANRLSIIPKVAEPIFVTDTNEFFVGDGVTAGGVVPSNLVGYLPSTATITTRNNITSRTEGMVVRVTANNVVYVLSGGTTNSYWNSSKVLQIMDVLSNLTAVRGADVTNTTSFYLRGLSAVGDGGEGEFQYNSASSATADSVDVLTPADGVGRFLRKRENKLRLNATTQASPKNGDIWYDSPTGNILARLAGSNIRLNYDPVVATVTALKTIKSSSKNTFVILLGVDVSFDGAGGLLVWRLGTATEYIPSIILPDDYGIAVGGDQGYWQKLM